MLVNPRVAPAHNTLGMLFFAMVFGMKLTYVFFSWLNEKLSTMSYWPMMALYSGFGVSLFLLPPVPGVPVYIIGGICVVTAGEDDVGGFVPSLLVCIAVCLLIKLTAVSMQQKLNMCLKHAKHTNTPKPYIFTCGHVFLKRLIGF